MEYTLYLYIYSNDEACETIREKVEQTNFYYIIIDFTHADPALMHKPYLAIMHGTSSSFYNTSEEALAILDEFIVKEE